MAFTPGLSFGRTLLYVPSNNVTSNFLDGEGSLDAVSEALLVTLGAAGEFEALLPFEEHAVIKSKEAKLA